MSPTAPSRGLVLKLNQATHTASLVGVYSHGDNFDADYMGSVEPLPGGNEIVGWGSAPYLSEFNAQGQLLLDGVFPGPDLSYRAQVEPWVGLPLYPPAGAARSKRWQDHGVRELERRHRAHLLEGSRWVEHHRADHGGEQWQVRLRDGDSGDRRRH